MSAFEISDEPWTEEDDQRGWENEGGSVADEPITPTPPDTPSEPEATESERL